MEGRSYNCQQHHELIVVVGGTVLIFTDSLLAKVIQICTDILHNSELTPPTIPKAFFPQLLTAATASVKFSFNKTTYKKIDDVAMRPPLVSAISHTFVGYYEKKLFWRNNKPVLYFRYIDDTFAICNEKFVCDSFLAALNSLHPCLTFTFVKEADEKLSFLDVMVEKAKSEFFTSVRTSFY